MSSYPQVICGVLIWAVINGFVIKEVGQSVAPTILGALMSLVGVVLYLPYLLKNLPSLDRKQVFCLFGLGITAALNNSFFYTAIAIKNVSEAALVHYFASVLAVVWVVLIPLFKEKLDKASLLSVGLGLIGLLIMVGNGWLKNELWLYFALLSAFFYSFEIVFSGQVSRGNVSPHFSAFTKLFFQLMIMPLVAVLLGQSFSVRPDQYGPIVLAGLLLFGSFILVFSGLRKVAIKHFAVLGYLDRLGAIAIGVLWWGERFGWNVWVGGALILFAEIPILFSGNKKGAN